MEISKKLEKDAKAPAKKATAADPAKIAQERQEKMNEKLEECKEAFFTTVSVDDDLSAIKARGEAN